MSDTALKNISEVGEIITLAMKKYTATSDEELRKSLKRIIDAAYKEYPRLQEAYPA